MLREISIGYDPVEDRIQLRLLCHEQGNDVNHRLALTRRISLPLRAGLQDLVRQSAEAPDTLPPPVQEALVAGHHQARLEQTEIRRKPTQPSVGDETASRLVLRAVCGVRRRDKHPVLRFEFQQGEPLTMAFGERSLHALAASLENRMRMAGWIPESKPPSDRAAASTPPPGLH